MLRYACCAVRLKVGPVMPGAAAKATGARNSVAATIRARNSGVWNVAFFIFFGLIAALLIAGVTECAAARDTGADMDFRHQATEVLGVIRKAIQLWGIEIEGDD